MSSRSADLRLPLAFPLRRSAEGRFYRTNPKAAQTLSFGCFGAVSAQPGGATDWPRIWWCSIRRLTRPEALASSTKAWRKRAPASLALAVPTAWCTAVNCRSRIRAYDLSR
jgi:hypothetical protein